MRDIYPTEEERGWTIARVAQAAHTRAPELLEALKVDVEHPEAWGHHPDVCERNARKLKTWIIRINKA